MLGEYENGIRIPSRVNATCHSGAWGQHRAQLGKMRQTGCWGDPR